MQCKSLVKTIEVFSRYRFIILQRMVRRPRLDEVEGRRRRGWSRACVVFEAYGTKRRLQIPHNGLASRPWLRPPKTHQPGGLGRLTTHHSAVSLRRLRCKFR